MRREQFKSQEDYSTHKNINVSQFNISQVYNLDSRSTCQFAQLIYDSGGRKIKPIN